jgi:hypothetical protein
LCHVSKVYFWNRIRRLRGIEAKRGLDKSFEQAGAPIGKACATPPFENRAKGGAASAVVRKVGQPAHETH